MMKKRYENIDLMKGIITILMITAHVIQFFPSNQTGLRIFSDYVNLTTFSGFLFCFGYACQIAYFQKQLLPINRIFIGFLKILIAYYISAFGFELLFLKMNNINTLLSVLYFEHISGYSEFLLSFVFLYLTVLLGGSGIKKILTNNRTILITLACSLALTYINYKKISVPQLSPLIGHKQIPSFPIIQYFSYFVIGAFMAKNKIVFNKKLCILTFLSSMAFIIYWILKDKLPHRFPPSLLWIIGGYGFIYGYFLFSDWLSKKQFPLKSTLCYIGQKTLSCLVISNLILFILPYHIKQESIMLPYFVFCLIASLLIIGICIGYNKIKTMITKIVYSR